MLATAVMARKRFYLLDTPNEGRTAMKRVGKLTLGTMGLLFLGVVLAAGDAFAQTAKDLVGTWTLVSAVTEQGGNKTDTFGPNPKGILTVDANGRYVLAFVRAGLPKVASNNRTTATPEENKAIVQGSATHFGTLSVNAADKVPKWVALPWTIALFSSGVAVVRLLEATLGRPARTKAST